MRVARGIWNFTSFSWPLTSLPPLSSQFVPLPFHISSLPASKMTSAHGQPKRDPSEQPSSLPPPADGPHNANGHLDIKPPPPPARPPLRSNFDLEPNPFEQSFSSTSVASQKTLNSDHVRRRSNDSSDTRRPSLSGDESRDGTRRNGDAGSNASNDTNKPMLPPLASIVSPADHSYGSWAMSSSLRSGPLSPAMLTGPANQTSLGLGAFDSSFVRTGLTPDVTRTGLTPLINGTAGYPPPTPNTLFAIVNGTTAPQALASTAAITPNTLNAIHGVLGQTLAVNGPTSVALDAQHTISNPHLTSQSYGSDHSMRGDPNGRQNGHPSQYSSYQNDSYTNGDQNHALTNAASALYLLSQQNNMRQAQGQGQGQVDPSQVSNDPHLNGHTNGHQDMETDPPSRRAAKRKSMDTPAPPTTRGGKKAKAAPAPVTRINTRRRSTKGAEPDDDDDDDEDDDSWDGNGNMSSSGALPIGKGGSKKPETEEEKRRNFLERNRQGELLPESAFAWLF